MICFKHAVPAKKAGKKEKAKKGGSIHYNVDYCIVCSKGGDLICCERCPSSLHTHCVGLDHLPDGSYLCSECTLGKSILYGDIVWVKMGNYRSDVYIVSESMKLTFLNFFLGGGLVEFTLWMRYQRDIRNINPKQESSWFSFLVAKTPLLFIVAKSFTIKME